VGVVGEDVEDHGRPVDHRQAGLLLEVALLARQQLVVAGHDVGARGRNGFLQLGQLALAEVAVRIGPGTALHQLPYDSHAGGPEQLAELGEVDVVGAGRHAQRPLSRPRVADSGAVAALCGASVPCSVHAGQV
jgi:hypothetical protein